MTLESLSLSMLDVLIEKTAQAAIDIQNGEVREQMSKMKEDLAVMRVALVELKHIEAEFKRGNLLSELYLDRHKKLVKDFYDARDDIANVVVSNVAENTPSDVHRKNIMKFKEFLKNNKDFILNASQLILTIISIFGKG